MMERIRQRKGEEGLTLIEILVVIIVLGILAGIVIFGIATFRGDSARAACETDGKSVEVAAEAFRAKNGAYPQAADGPTIQQLVDAEYLKTLPGTTEYTISLADDGTVTATLDADNVAAGESADCFA